MRKIMTGAVVSVLSGVALAAFDTQHVDPERVHAKYAVEAEALYAPAYAKYKAEVEDPWNAKAKAANDAWQKQRGELMAAWAEAKKKDPNAPRPADPPRPNLGRRQPYEGPKKLPDVRIQPAFEAKVDAAYEKDLAAFRPCRRRSARASEGLTDGCT